MKKKVCVSINHLCKFYGKFQAIKDISLKINGGEIFGLLGPNGAGKSTLIGIMSTLLKVNKGDVIINGYDLKKYPREIRKSIGIVFQETILDFELNAVQNLDFHARLYGISKEKRDEKIEKLLKLVGLWEQRNRRVEKFSGGMKRRLEIARGLLHEPKILFLDEPTLGLDPKTRRTIWEYILDLKNKKDMTILLTTHYMEEADFLCDTVAIMDKGKIKAINSPKKLKSDLQGDIIKLKLDKIDPKIIEKLKNLNFVLEVKVLNDYLELIIKNADMKLMKLIDFLKKSKKEIKEITLSKPSLEDVFLNLTGKEIEND